MSDGSEGQPGDAQPPGLANDDYEPPVRPRRTGLRIVAVVVLASFLLATLFGYGSIIWDAHRSYFWPRSEYSSQYPGDTERIGRTWTLDNSKNEIEALEEAQAIALDPKASKEEQSTAEAEVAFSAWDLGETDVASSAIADFDKDSPGLNLDPVVVNQEKWTEYYLKGNIAAKSLNPISGMDWAAASKTLQNPSFAEGLAGWIHRTGTYTVATDPNGFAPGKPSAYMAASDAPDSDWNWLWQGVAGENYVGKRVELTAWLKADNVNRRAYLEMRIDTPSVVFHAYAPHGFLKGTTVWQRQSIVLDVPPDAQGITFGLVLYGSGKASMASLNLQAVGKDIPPRRRAPYFNQTAKHNCEIPRRTLTLVTLREAKCL